MGKVIAKTGVKRQAGYLYFLNKAGDVARVQMARSGQKTSKKQEVGREAAQRSRWQKLLRDGGHVSRGKHGR